MNVRLIAGLLGGLIAMPGIAPAAQAPSRPIAHLPSGVEADSGPVRIRVIALTASIIHVEVARGGTFPENASWAVPAAVRNESIKVSATADGFRTGAIEVHLNPATLQLTLSDLSGRTISTDLPQPIRFDARGFALRKAVTIKEHYFGMGDKT